MAGPDDVRRLMVNAIASAAIIDKCTPRQRLQQFCFPRNHYGGHHYYGYYDYPPFPEEQKFGGIIPWLLRALKLCAIWFTLLISSVAIYGLFYWAVMPGSYASRPLFFDYTGTVAYPHRNATLTTLPTIDNHSRDKKNGEIVTPSSLCTATPTSKKSVVYEPWASVDLFAIEQAISWGETTYKDLIPPPTIQNRILQPKQAFYVEVHLTLPESATNQQIGMFGVACDLVSHPDRDGTVVQLASSVRPARLPFESDWLAVARKLFWIIPLVLGGMEESRVIVITSFRHMLESKSYPLRHVVTRLVGQTPLLQRQGAGGSQIPPVEVVAGEVRIGKELNQWQQVLKDWFYACYFVGTMVLLGAHIAAWMILEYYWGENKDEYGAPYFDPSCDFSCFSERHDDGFESIRSDEDVDGLGLGNPSCHGSMTGRQNNDGDSNDKNIDEDSEDWEECQSIDLQEVEQGGRQLESEYLYPLHRENCRKVEAAINDSTALPQRRRDGNSAYSSTFGWPSAGTRRCRKKSNAAWQAVFESIDGVKANDGTVGRHSPSSVASLPRKRLSLDRSAASRGGLKVYGDNGGSAVFEARILPAERTAQVDGVEAEREGYTTVSSIDSLDEDHFYDCIEPCLSVTKKRRTKEFLSLNDTVLVPNIEVHVPLRKVEHQQAGALKLPGNITKASLWNSRSLYQDQHRPRSRSHQTDYSSSNKMWNAHDLDEGKSIASCSVAVTLQVSSGESSNHGPGCFDKGKSAGHSTARTQRERSKTEQEVSFYHGPQSAIFQVPEAQILDSFVNDLINPFVR